MSKSNGTKSKSSGEQPVFNFGHATRGWHKSWNRFQTRSSELMLEAEESQENAETLREALEADGIDEQKKKELKAEQNANISKVIQYMREVEAIAEEQERLLARVLVDVPRSWVDEDAPDDLDWSDPASLDWLVGDKYMLLVQAVQAERQGNSKN